VQVESSNVWAVARILLVSPKKAVILPEHHPFEYPASGTPGTLILQAKSVVFLITTAPLQFASANVVETTLPTGKLPPQTPLVDLPPLKATLLQKFSPTTDEPTAAEAVHVSAPVPL